MSPLQASLIFGLISIILSLIGFIIYSLIKYNDLTLFNNIFDFSNIDNKLKITIFFILLIIFCTIFHLLTLLILFYFTPIFLCISEIISPFLFWIVQTIEKNTNTKFEIVIYPIGYTIVLFSSLVYNEIIIFNFCGLNKNTKKCVNERMDEEILEMSQLCNNNHPDRNTINSDYEIEL